MTTLTALMLTDTTKATPRKGALRRLRARVTGGRRFADGPAEGRPTNALLHDVAVGGTAATAANSFLEKLATGRRV